MDLTHIKERRQRTVLSRDIQVLKDWEFRCSAVVYIAIPRFTNAHIVDENSATIEIRQYLIPFQNQSMFARYWKFQN